MRYFFLLWTASTLGWFLLSALLTLLWPENRAVVTLKSAAALGMFTSVFISSIDALI